MWLLVSNTICILLFSTIKSGNGGRSGKPAGSGVSERRKEATVSSTVTVANNNKQDKNSDEGKRPDLGILIRGLPVRSSGVYLLKFRCAF